jgi:endonuclease/exonuclease/phosphatase family metal-dependent hydrolase
MPVVRILTWNIQGIRGLPQARLDGILERIGQLRPDVLLLQEVGHGGSQPVRLGDGLAKLGLEHFHHALPKDYAGPPLTHGNYGSAIASRWPLTAHDADWLQDPADQELWADLLARATIHAGDLDLEVISAHIPNGSGYGWKKIEHFEALARQLDRLKGQAVILGGDFNEPRIERPGGRWICWGEDLGADGEWRVWESWAHKGVRDTGERWDAAVRSVLAEENIGGLVDACRAVRGADAVAGTHLSRGQERFFDHLMVSPQLRVAEMGFEHAWRTEGWSDHSAVWATIEVGA